MAKSRANGNPNYVNQNYTAIVVDAAGVQILPHVKTFGARGTTPKWGYDKNGAIVEMGWSKKMDLYRIINDVSQAVSVRVQAIDTRVIALMSDAQSYMMYFKAYADAQKEIDDLYALIPSIFSLTGQPLLAKGAGFIAKLQKPDDYKTLSLQVQRKLISLESELKALEVLKNGLTGEYAKFDKVVTDAGRSANITDNWVWMALGLLVLFILIKRKQA